MGNCRHEKRYPIWMCCFFLFVLDSLAGPLSPCSELTGTRKKVNTDIINNLLDSTVNRVYERRGAAESNPNRNKPTHMLSHNRQIFGILMVWQLWYNGRSIRPWKWIPIRLYFFLWFVCLFWSLLVVVDWIAKYLFIRYVSTPAATVLSYRLKMLNCG